MIGACHAQRVLDAISPSGFPKDRGARDENPGPLKRSLGSAQQIGFLRRQMPNAAKPRPIRANDDGSGTADMSPLVRR